MLVALRVRLVVLMLNHSRAHIVQSLQQHIVVRLQVSLQVYIQVLSLACMQEAT